MSYLRLRQICLVASDLAKVEGDLQKVLGADICYRDKGVEKYGLHNALFALGGTFLEVVSPLKEGTTAGRYIERRKGDGGYMYITDCDNLEDRRDYYADVDVRLVEDLKVTDDWATSEALHLHPKDTGGCLLSVDRHSGGEDMMGEYHWAGPSWQSKARNDCRLAGADMQCEDPYAVATRWGELLMRPVINMGQGTYQIHLDNAFARFVPFNDDRGEGLCALRLDCTDPSVPIKAAKEIGLPHTNDSIEICGVTIRVR